MKRTAKITSLILCLAILLGSVIGLTSVGAEGFTAEISEANVKYGDKMYMLFTVESLGADLTNIGIATYTAAEGEAPIHTSKGQETFEGRTYYTTYGIPAKDITTTFYYAVVDANGNEISARTPYSVKTYADARLTLEDNTAEQIKLYNAIINYGQAADAVFGN